MRDFIKKHWLEAVLILFSLMIYVFVIYPTIKIDFLSYDSSYQYALNNKDFREMMRLIPYDYSPCFYSVFLKTFSCIFGNSLNTLRLSSLIIYLGIVLLSLYPVKRAFGAKVSYVTYACIVLNSSYYLLFYEIRPQVLGFLLVSTAAVYTFLVYKEGKRKDLILLTIFSILAMYTHTVAMFAMFCYYGILLLFSLFKKDFKKSVNVLISGLVCAILYIPNLIMLIHQYSNVRNNYWHSMNIGFTNLMNDTFLTSFFAFRTSFFGLILLLLFILSGGVALCVYIMKKKKNKQKKDISDDIFTLLLFWCPTSLFMVVTMNFLQIYADRYIYMFMFIAILEVVIFISKIDRKNILVCLLSATIIFNFCLATKWNQDRNKSFNWDAMAQTIKAENPDETKISFVHSHEWTLGIMMYYFPNSNHYVTDDVFCVLNSYDVFPTDVIDIGSPDNILDYTDKFFTIEGTVPNSLWDSGAYYSEWECLSKTDYGAYTSIEGSYYVADWVLFSKKNESNEVLK